MQTNLALDDNLLKEALRVGNHETTEAAVTEALKEYIERHRQLQVLEAFGKIDYEEGFDYKVQRQVQ